MVKKPLLLIALPIKDIIENLLLLNYKVAYDKKNSHIEIWDRVNDSVSVECEYRYAYENISETRIPRILITINCLNSHQIQALKALIQSILDSHINKYIEVTEQKEHQSNEDCQA